MLMETAFCGSIAVDIRMCEAVVVRHKSCRCVMNGPEAEAVHGCGATGPPAVPVMIMYLYDRDAQQ